MAEQLTQVGYIGYSGTGYTYCSEIIINSQDIEHNQSNITVNFKVMPTGNSAGYEHYRNLSATMSITSDNGLTQSVDITGYKTANTRNVYSTIGTWRGDVTHKNDGSLYVTVAVQYGFTSSLASSDPWLPKQTSTNFVCGLTTIPRASDIALSASALTISDTSGSITWTATSKADYYHTLTWSLGGSNIVITALNHLNNTTQTGTLSYTTLLSKLPSNATGTLTLTLNTYSDSGRTSPVGTKTASCSITITIIPSITTYPNPSVLTSPITNYAIAGYSTMQVANIATSKPSGASNVTTYVSTNYVQMATGSFTGTSGTVTTQTLPAKEDGNDTFNITFTAYAQDTRGNRSGTVSKTATVYKYIKPTPNLTAYRVASSGSTTQDSAGTYLYVHATATLNSSINGQNSIQTKVVKVNNTTTTVDANGDAWVSLPANTRATVTYDVSDKVASTSAVPVQVSVAKYPLHMYDDGAGNVGTGMGAMATNGWFNCSLNMRVGDGQSEGWQRWYSDAGGYTNIKLTSGQTGTRNIRFPNKSGTLALREDFNYSTSETNTGITWVDGKTIYSKTLSYNNTGIGNGTVWNHGIANISEVVKTEGHLNANGTYIGFPNTTNNSANDLGFRVDTTQIQWFGNDSWGAQTSRTIYITIWYTKTS